ncbi:MAG: PilZ domain-containing protein [Alphaproteobacteria bacterium]
MLAYEELRGSQGREVWFRPPRYEARKLFPHVLPRVRVGGHLYNLQNISLGGVAALAQHGADSPLEVGEVVPLTIQQSGLSIFESEARVCRTETTVFGTKVAFHFLNNHVEFETLLNRNTQAQIARRSAMLNGELSQLVSKDYRAFCSDVLNVLRSYRVVLDENANLARQFGHGFDEGGAFEACIEPLLSQWRALWRMGNDLARAVEHKREALEASKEFTEIVLTPEMRGGAIWERSYAKPFGYPGDFGVMNQVYDWERRGNDVYQMLLHRLGLEVAECIKTRMEVVKGVISRLLRERGADGTAQVMSLGSGPAREVELYLAGTHVLPARAEFTLIDQEQAALRYAFEKTYPHIVRLKQHARVRCLNMSFTEILKSNEAFEAVPPQDLIYSVGLLDYLVDRRAARLTQSLYNTLAHGGLLIIGNMNETELSNLWPMEFIADWTLHYRDGKQMLAWVDGLRPAQAWTELDPTGRVRLLYVRKP